MEALSRSDSERQAAVKETVSTLMEWGVSVVEGSAEPQVSDIGRRLSHRGF